MEILEPRKQTIYGKEYYCYGPSMTEDNFTKKDYYRNQYDNFNYNNEGALISEKKTPNFRKCNICNITSMIMCLKLMRIVLPQTPSVNSLGNSLSRDEEKLACFMYNSGITDPTIPNNLIRGTNLWLKKEISGNLSVNQTEQKNALKDLLVGLPVLMSGYFFNTVVSNGKGEPHAKGRSDGGYDSIKEDANGNKFNGVEGHYVCISAIAFSKEYIEGAVPEFYQIQDPYAKTFSSKKQVDPYLTGETGNDSGKDIWITKEQFKRIFSPRKDTKDFRSIRFSNNAAVIDEKWAEFSNIVTLPDLLNNYNTNGWFSKDAATSYMYSSGYNKINGKYPGLVKIFEDEDVDVEGFSEIEAKDLEGVKALDINKINNQTIENLSPVNIKEKLFEISNGEQKKYFANRKDKRYFVGDIGDKENIANHNWIPIVEGPFATIVRYPKIIEGNNIAKFFTNFIKNGKGYLIAGGNIKNNNGDVEQKLPELIGQGGYINLKRLFAIAGFDTSAAKGAKRDEWLTETEIANLKSFKEYIGYTYKGYENPFALEIFDVLNDDIKGREWIFEELKNGTKKYKSNLVDKIVKSFNLCDNEKKWLAIFAAIIYCSYGKGNYLSSEKNYSKGYYCPEINFNKNEEYWPDTDEEKKEINNVIKEINNGKPFYGIMNKNIYYLGEGLNSYSHHIPIKNFGNKMGTNVISSGITEISEPITKAEIFKDSENYILKGVRIYFNWCLGKHAKSDFFKFKNIHDFANWMLHGDSKKNIVYNFDTCIEHKIDDLSTKGIKELAFFFRYNGEGENKGRLYKYVISLHKYENVVNANSKTKALYFVPFLCDLSKLNNGIKSLFFEAYYSTIDENDNYLLEPSVVKPYLQFGDFSGDILGITQNKDYKLCTSHLIPLNENTSTNESRNKGIEYCIYNTMKEEEKSDINLYMEPPIGFKDLNISAKELKEMNTVIGCFSLNPPNAVNKKSEWADSQNSNAKSIPFYSLLKTMANQKDCYKYSLKLIENKEDGQKTEYNFGKIENKDMIKLIDLDGKVLKFNKFKYYTGYGIGEELTDYPIDPVDYGNYKTVSAPYNAGEQLFVAELQYGFNTNKEQLFGSKEYLSNEEKAKVKWIPDTINCTIRGNKVTSLGLNDDIISLNSTRGEKNTPALFENVSKNMIDILASLLGERISLYKTTNAEDCNMYINELGYLVHGYGLSYSLACYTKKNEIRKQFEKCIEDNKNNLFSVGKEYAVIENPEKSLASMSEGEKKNYQSKIEIGASKLGAEKEEVYILENPIMRNVVKGYNASITEAKKLLEKYISDICIGRTIACLKAWQLCLEGKNNFSQEQIEKNYSQDFSLFEETKTMGHLNQTAYELLVVLAYFENDFENLQRCISSIIKEKVNGRELTEEQKKAVFENAFKQYLKEHVNINSDLDKYALKNYKLKDLLLKNKENFKIIATTSSVKNLGNRVTDKKLTIELTCTAITGGLLETVMGRGFNILAQAQKE